MGNLFHYDNPIWRFMGKVTDIFFLTLLWVFLSLPVVTIGASSSALYYVSLKMARNEESYIFQSFWKAFKENIRQSTVLWLIMLALGFFFAGGLYIWHRAQFQGAVFIFWLYFVFALLYLFMLMLMPPLTARLDTDIKNLFFMTFMVMLKNFSWVLFMAVIAGCIIALGVFVFWPILFISAGGIAFTHSKILEYIIFPKYGWDSVSGTEAKN